MRVPSSIAIALVLIGAVRCLGADIPGDRSDLGDNAALQYWQGFAELPVLDPAEQKALENCENIGLDGAADALLDKARPSLMYLHRGERLQRCAWGLDYKDGPNLLMPHLGKARALARFAVLHMRQQLTRHQWHAGAEDTLALLRFARHVGVDPVLIARIVDTGIEFLTIEQLAPFLPDMDAPSLKLLADGLATLAPAATLQSCIIDDRRFTAEPLAQRLQQAALAKDSRLKDILDAFVDPQSSTRLTKELETTAHAAACSRDFPRLYDEILAMSELPSAEFAKQYRDFENAIARNPLALGMLPNLQGLRAAFDRQQTRMELLRAAIAVVQGGSERVKDVKDPFGDGPFQFRGLDHGFVLTSKLVYRGEPVSLTFGQDKDKPSR